MYGFTDVYDYVDGKVDWMAFGLPVEGDDGPFLGEVVEAASTCDVTLTVAEARPVVESTGATAVVLASGLVVGEVDTEALAGHADDVQLLEVLRPVPSTVRPSVTVASVAEAGGGQPLVTTSDGRLLGRASVEAADHHHGDDEHDHAADEDGFEQEIAEVMKAAQERFGDREPSAAELRAFLHERLVAEGRSVEDADRFLDGLDA